MSVRAIRGATMLSADDAAEMTAAVAELIAEMLSRNGITSDEIISMLLTSTPDLTCAFPAAAARTLGFADVPLICAQEIDVAGAPQRVVRIMAHAELTVPRSDVKHVYLRGAEVLRLDIAQ